MDYKVFGCKTNKYFTERWLSHPYLDGKSGYFIASCIVTDRAKAKWVKYALEKVHTLKKGEKLYLSGCGNLKNGTVNPEFYTVYPEFLSYQDRIELLSEDPGDFLSFEGKINEKKQIQEKIRSFRNLSRKAVFTRKYLVIQTGCDNFCTFCLTIQARGKHVSRPQDEILQEIREFIDTGGKEVVLTGTNLGAWGASSSNRYDESLFPSLVESILEKTTIERIRISSLGVEFCTPRLIELFSEPRINAYIHLSVQSGADPILRRMSRHYDEKRLHEVLADIRNIKRVDSLPINIGADIIVGFPGETEDDFMRTYNLVKEYGISQLHAFPFSRHITHESVPAGDFPDQIPEKEKLARLARLRALADTIFQEFLEKNSTRDLEVLIEKVQKDTFSGWSENYIFCNEQNFSPFPGQEIARGKSIRGSYIFQSQ